MSDEKDPSEMTANEFAEWSAKMCREGDKEKADDAQWRSELRAEYAAEEPDEVGASLNAMNDAEYNAFAKRVGFQGNARLDAPLSSEMELFRKNGGNLGND